MTDLKKELSKHCLNCMLDIISDCLKVNEPGQLKTCINNLQDLFEYGHAFCVYSNTAELIGSKQPVLEMINVSYPDIVLDVYFQDEYNLRDPVANELVKTQSVQNWDLAFKKNEMVYPDWGQDLKILNGYTFGIFENRFSTATTFSFSQVEKKHSQRTETILEQIGPHLAEAMKRALGIERVSNIRLGSTLTHREREVLNWIIQGKSSWETAMILNISERTVNFHTDHIFKKLNASNRAHAVAIALTLGITTL